MENFRKELETLINKNSLESGSNTPDFILVEYLIECLKTFDKIVYKREEWYGRGYPQKREGIEMVCGGES